MTNPALLESLKLRAAANQAALARRQTTTRIVSSTVQKTQSPK